jgi:hypothetical protein
MLSVAIELPADVQTAADVAAAVAAYPTLRGVFALKQGPSGAVRADPPDTVPRHHVLGAERVNVAVTCPAETTMSDFWSRQRTLASVIEVDERVPAAPAPSLVGFALPNLAAADAPYPLMLWWALLLGLSSLARYEPADWTAALDLDESELAVGLERVLDIADERVPKRLLRELRAA